MIYVTCNQLQEAEMSSYDLSIFLTQKVIIMREAIHAEDHPCRRPTESEA